MSFTKKMTENANKKAFEGFISPEDKKYMEGKPTRIEIANYVTNLMDNHYMPMITNYIQMSSMVLQGILLKKEICTGDEIKEITEEFVKESHRRQKETQALKKINEPVVYDIENGLVDRINQVLKNFSSDQWKSEELSDDERKSLYTSLYTSMIDLVNIHINSDDEELMKDIEEELPKLNDELTNLKKLLENGTIVIKDTTNKSELETLIEDIIKRFSNGLQLPKNEPTSKETSSEGNEV